MVALTMRLVVQQGYIDGPLAAHLSDGPIAAASLARGPLSTI